MKALKVHTVNADGSRAKDDIDVEILDPETKARILDDAGNPCVVVTVRPVSQTEWRKLLKKHTRAELNRGSRAMEDKTDTDAAERELLQLSIIRWTGFIGADDRPLPCTDATKVELDPRVKNVLVERILGAEVVEATEASFCESA